MKPGSILLHLKSYGNKGEKKTESQWEKQERMIDDKRKDPGSGRCGPQGVRRRYMGILYVHTNLLTTNRGAGTYRTQVVGTRPILSYGPCTACHQIHRRSTQLSSRSAVHTISTLGQPCYSRDQRACLGLEPLRGVQQNGERLREGARDLASKPLALASVARV